MISLALFQSVFQVHRPQYFLNVHSSLDPSKRECEDLSEQKTDYVSESALMENLKDGLVLHRLWIGLDVFEADGNCKTISSTKPLTEGTVFSLCGCLRGQAGVSS